VEFALHLPVLAMVPEIVPPSTKKQKLTASRNSSDSGLEVGARA
jgi:hypothetical protein